MISVIFTVQAAPGPRSEAAFIESENGRPLLLLDLDPVQVWLEVPPVPAGPGVMAAFLRQLARQSTRMAQRLDEMATPTVTELEPAGPVAGGRGRHAGSPGWDAQAGAL